MNTPHVVSRPPKVVKPAKNKIPPHRKVVQAAHDLAIRGGERAARGLVPRIDFALALAHHHHRLG